MQNVSFLVCSMERPVLFCFRSFMIRLSVHILFNLLLKFVHFLSVNSFTICSVSVINLHTAVCDIYTQLTKEYVCRAAVCVSQTVWHGQSYCSHHCFAQSHTLFTCTFWLLFFRLCPSTVHRIAALVPELPQVSTVCGKKTLPLPFNDAALVPELPQVSTVCGKKTLPLPFNETERAGPFTIRSSSVRGPCVFAVRF